MYEILYKDNVEAVVAAPVDSATVVEVGQMLKLAAGEVAPVVDEDDNATFEGVAKTAKRAIDTHIEKVTISRRNAQAVFEAPLDTATSIVYGDTLAINNSKSLKKSATKVVAKAVETKADATSVRVIFVRRADDIGA